MSHEETKETEMAQCEKQDGIRLPSAMVAALAMFLITSGISGVYSYATLSARVDTLEKATQGVPVRLALLEGKVSDMTTILQDIRNDIRQTMAQRR